MADSPKLRQLAELQARQEAILSGMQDQRAMYPSGGELSGGSLDGHKPATSNVYEYRPEHLGKPGTAPGRQGGPMAHELRGLPGVVEPGPDGMDRVNEPRLTMHNTSAIGELARKDQGKDAELERLNARLDALAEATRDPNDAEESALSGRY